MKYQYRSPPNSSYKNAPTSFHKKLFLTVFCIVCIWMAVFGIVNYVIDPVVTVLPALFDFTTDDDIQWMIRSCRIVASCSLAAATITFLALFVFSPKLRKGDAQLIGTMSLADIGLSITFLVSTFASDEVSKVMSADYTSLMTTSLTLYGASIPAGLNITSMFPSCSPSPTSVNPPPCIVPCLLCRHDSIPAMVAKYAPQINDGTCDSVLAPYLASNPPLLAALTQSLPLCPNFVRPDFPFATSNFCQASSFFLQVFIGSIVMHWLCISFHLHERLVKQRSMAEINTRSYHYLIWCFSILIAVPFLVVRKLSGPSGPWCWTSLAYPYTRSSDAFFYAPLLLTLCYTTYSIVSIVLNVRKIERSIVTESNIGADTYREATPKESNFQHTGTSIKSKNTKAALKLLVFPLTTILMSTVFLLHRINNTYGTTFHMWMLRGLVVIAPCNGLINAFSFWTVFVWSRMECGFLQKICCCFGKIKYDPKEQFSSSSFIPTPAATPRELSPYNPSQRASGFFGGRSREIVIQRESHFSAASSAPSSITLPPRASSIGSLPSSAPLSA